MSIWYEVDDIDDIDISNDGKSIEVNYKNDNQGAHYVEIPIDLIKQKLKQCR